MRNSVLLMFYFLLFSLGLSAQNLSGVVLDQKTKQPIPDALVEVLNTDLAEFTDQDGRFLLKSVPEGAILQIDATDYEIKKVEATSGQDLTILLEKIKTSASNPNSDLKIQDITLSKKPIPTYRNKKENPAYAIMQKVWENKKKNGVKSAAGYTFEKYEKLQFDIANADSALMSRKFFNGFEFLKEKVQISEVTGRPYLPLFINEALYKVEGKNNPDNKEISELLANKSAGVEDNEIISGSLQNIYEKYDLYQDRIYIFYRPFVSPIATDGFSSYNYELLGTIEMDGVECYRIRYEPKASLTNTFKGELYIAKENYMVKEARLQSPSELNLNFVNQIYLEQSFKLDKNNTLVPEREYVMIDLSLTSKKESFGVYAHRTTLFSKYDLSVVPHPDEYYLPKVSVDVTDAFAKDDQFWAENRPYDLSEEEKGIYETSEKLNDTPKFKAMVKAGEILGSGYYNVGNIDLGSIFNTVGYNDVEGFRLRFGFRTFFSPNDMWRIGAYTAYGFRDEQFKYGAEGRYMFNTHNRFTLGIGHKSDYEMPNDLITPNEIMQRRNSSASLLTIGGINKLTDVSRTKVYADIEPIKNLKFGLGVTHQNIQSADTNLFDVSYQIPGEPIRDELTDTNVNFMIEYTPGADYSRYGVDRYERKKKTSSSVTLIYTRGIKDALGADFNYNRMQFELYSPIKMGSVGLSRVFINAGKTFEPVPLALLHVLPANPNVVTDAKKFSLMQFYEFVTDEYFTFHWQHHFDGFIISKIPLLKETKLKLISKVNIGYGSVSQGARDLNQSNWIYVAPSRKPYIEYGFGIENIGFGNYRMFRVDFMWRDSYLDGETSVNSSIPAINKFGIQGGFTLNL
ncbi:MAG: hypothetical protein C4K58_02275 [Flavobacteriaceae bacterium]|nr:MAG: hypothetical protein C4K58_02275 [Flavobacteriaceae bacterium]